MTWQEAHARGLSIYFSDKACRKGHQPARRYVSNDVCCICVQNNNIKFRERQLIRKQVSGGLAGGVWPSAAVDVTFRVHRDDIATAQAVLEALWLARGFVVPGARVRKTPERT